MSDRNKSFRLRHNSMDEHDRAYVQYVGVQQQRRKRQAFKLRAVVGNRRDMVELVSFLKADLGI